MIQRDPPIKTKERVASRSWKKCVALGHRKCVMAHSGAPALAFFTRPTLVGLGEAASFVLPVPDRRELPGHRLEGLLFRLFRTNAPIAERIYQKLALFRPSLALASSELFPQILFTASRSWAAGKKI